MTAREDVQAIRAETARRYAEYVSSTLQVRGWDQAMLARRSGLSKQQVSIIVNGGGVQPTATQIVAIANAFRVTPEHVLAGIGLWPRAPRRDGVDPDMATVYGDLDHIQRRALLQIGHALREAQEAYETRDIGRLASFSGATQEEQEQAKREALDSGERPD